MNKYLLVNDKEMHLISCDSCDVKPQSGTGRTHKSLFFTLKSSSSPCSYSLCSVFLVPFVCVCEWVSLQPVEQFGLPGCFCGLSVSQQAHMGERLLSELAASQTPPGARSTVKPQLMKKADQMEKRRACQWKLNHLSPKCSLSSSSPFPCSNPPPPLPQSAAGEII